MLNARKWAVVAGTLIGLCAVAGRAEAAQEPGDAGPAPTPPPTATAPAATPASTDAPPVAAPLPAPAGPAEPAPAAGAPAATVKPSNRVPYGDADHTESEDFMGVPLHGFSSVQLGLDDQKRNELRRGYARGFQLDNVVLYLAPDLGDRVRFLTEIALEPGFDDQSVGVDVERLQIGYVFSNYLAAHVGRFHTPLGYHITAFHHGAHMMTAVEKPEFLDFEDHKGVLPVHTTGLWLTGQVLLGRHRLGYMGFAGNGDRLTNSGNFTTLDMNMVHDDNRDIAVGARLSMTMGGALEGLFVGLTAMTQRIDYSGDADPGATLNVKNPFQSRFRTAIAHAVYDAHGIEFANELHTFSNITTFQDGVTPSRTVQSWAAYSQLAYWFDGVVAPFVRVERGHFDERDNFFASQINGVPYTKVAAGARYNLNEKFCVKLEASHKELDGSSVNIAAGNINTVRTQLAVRF